MMRALTPKIGRKLTLATLSYSTILDIGISIFIALLPLVVFWALFTPNSPDRYIFTGDVLVGAYPTRVYIHTLLTSGEMPLWNLYQLGGMPLLADAQVAVFYLPNLLLSALNWNTDISYTAFEGLIIAHYALGALFMYGYLRNLKLSPWAALVGAIAFEFNGFFIGHRGHYSMLSVVVWVPGIMWMLDLAWKRPLFRHKLSWGLLASLMISQLIMGGHPQLTLYCTVFIVAYALFQFRLTWYQESPNFSRFWQSQFFQNIAVFGISGMLAGAVASISILPTWELLQRSIRHDASYTFAAQFPLMPRNLITLLVPEFLNWSGTEFRIYAGILTLILATIAIVMVKDGDKKRPFFITILIIATLLSFGGFTSLLGFIYRYIPGFSLVRISARIFYFANISLCILAAFGAEYLIQPLTKAKAKSIKKLIKSTRWLLLPFGLIGITLYTLLIWNNMPEDESFYFYDSLFINQAGDDTFAFLTQVTNQFGIFITLLALSLGIIWLRANKQLRITHFILTIILLLIIDLTSFATQHDAAPVSDINKVALDGFEVRTLEAWELRDQQQLIEYLIQLPDNVRIDNSAGVLPDNYSQVWGSSFATGYNVLDIMERFEMRTSWPELSPENEWRLFNVGYVVEQADNEAAPHPEAELVISNSQGKIWRLPSFEQYAHFSSQVRLLEPGITINGYLSSADNLYSPAAITAVNDDTVTVLDTYWPELSQIERFKIGTTEVQSPVSISVLGGGSQQYSAIVVDGKTVSLEERGVIVATIDPLTGDVLASVSFDTYQSDSESAQMAHFLSGVSQGVIVTAVTYDEGLSRFTEDAQRALASIGAQAQIVGQAGQIYGVIGVKGSEPGTAVEMFSADPIMLDVGLGAQFIEETAVFESHITAYQQDEIRLQIRNNQKGLLTISETIYPGWKAYINGEKTPILRSNGIFRSVIIPPSTNNSPTEVIFRFEPASVRLSGIVSLGAVGLIIIMLILLLIYKTPKKPQSNDHPPIIPVERLFALQSTAQPIIEPNEKIGQR